MLGTAPPFLLQGFASGDCARDAEAIRIFLEDGHQLGTSQSYAKNMGVPDHTPPTALLHARITQARASQIRSPDKPKLCGSMPCVSLPYERQANSCERPRCLQGCTGSAWAASPS